MSEIHPHDWEPTVSALSELVGCERSVVKISQSLHFAVAQMRPAAVGAMHITCADESELECVNAFQRNFVHYLLPKVKFGHQAPFRLANLGGRYEWNSVRVAESHFATPESREERAFKVLVVKINSHVGVELTGHGEEFGHLLRYKDRSTCCGALAALLDNEHHPFTERLFELFTSEGLDRIAILHDASQTERRYRSLLAALVAARLQARAAAMDIQDYVPLSPTLYLVVPCVTVNREQRDTEIVCGVYVIDRRGEHGAEEYIGLGDDPSKFELDWSKDLLTVRDESSEDRRPARDHREQIFELWRRRHKEQLDGHAEFEELRNQIVAGRHLNEAYTKSMLQAALILLAEIAPVSTALFLFAQGGVQVHHIYRARRLAQGLAGDDESRRILDDFRVRFDKLPPDRKRMLLESIVHHYG